MNGTSHDLDPDELAERIRSGVQAARAARSSLEDLSAETARREAALDAAIENLRGLGLDGESIEATLGEAATIQRGRHAGPPRR
ncbi:MAG: hypothetical protein ACRYF3_16445 [Janthinobacterium lividum]